MDIYYIYVILYVLIYMIIIIYGGEMEQVENIEKYIIGIVILLVILYVMIKLLFAKINKKIKTGIVLGIVIVVGIIIMYIYYSYYEGYYKMKNGIKAHIEKEYKEYEQEYIRDGNDIRNIYGLRIDEKLKDILIKNEKVQNIKEIMKNLMYDEEKARNFVYKIMMVENLNLEKDELYNIIWYLITNKNIKNNIGRAEKKYICKLSKEELEKLLGKKYNGPKDKGSMIFTCLYGYRPPISNIKRYKEIKDYDPKIVYGLIFENEGIYKEKEGPYIKLAKEEKTKLEKLILDIIKEKENKVLDEIIEKYELEHDKSKDIKTKKQKIIEDIVLYKNVLNRPEEFSRPIRLHNLNDKDFKQTISYYTNKELIKKYEPRGYWNTRKELLDIIDEDVNGEAKWFFSNKYCINDKTINILTGENHEDNDKNDTDDPIISYGKHKIYSCYQISEIDACFREYDGFYEFRNPDWQEHSQYIKEFPLESIKQLKELLVNKEKGSKILSLLKNINEGIKKSQSDDIIISRIKRTFEKFTYDQKNLATKYIVWMFLYSMWMRFWKGPSYPLPITKSDQKNRSTPNERNEYVFIQQDIRSNLLNDIEKDILLYDWINKLPHIYYDFDDNTYKVSKDTIKTILDKIAHGKYCMGFGSDNILKTSVFYILKLFDLQIGSSFNSFINSNINLINDIEYYVIINQLNLVEDKNSIKFKILSSRLKSLHFNQYTIVFNPTDFKTNLHT